ncbi:MAG: hypothetical protein EA392_07865 [Cryomorphaceae bacterium]|nr:MAG: hypothetical protein EA392_07865 [Cryomorphaceae bacterium]
MIVRTSPLNKNFLSSFKGGFRFLLKALVLLLFVLAFRPVFGQYVDAGAVLWLAPESEKEIVNGKVVSWSSLVGDVTLHQPDTSAQPTHNEAEQQLNGLSTVQFGLTTYYELEISVSQPLTMVNVFRVEENAQAFLYDTPSRLFLFIQPNSTIKPGVLPTYSSPVPNEYFIVTFHRASGGNAAFFENNELKVAGSETRSVNGTLNVGLAWSEDRPFRGSLAEMILYNEALSDAQLDTLWHQLKAKYAPPPSLGGVRYILPDCPLFLEVANRFKTVAWYSLSEDGDEELLAWDENSLEVSTPGQYIIEVESIFDDVYRDTVQVLSFAPPALSGSVCQDGPHEIDLNLEDASLQIEWSEAAWEGTAVAIDEPGSYSVTLTQSDGCGVAVDFQVYDTPEASEILMPETFCTGNILQPALTPLPGHSYTWFLDGEETVPVPEVDGWYVLFVTGPNGCSSSDSVWVEIAGEAPTPMFEYDVACAGQDVVFQNTSQTSDGSDIAETSWIIDGIAFTGSQVVFQPADTSSFTVSIEVITTAGCSAGVSQNVEVFQSPQALFDVGLICSGSPALYEDLSTISSGFIVDWLWDFGTTQVGGVPQTTHVFNIPGVQQVSLQIWSDEGCSDIFTGSVAVNPTPEASFNWQPTCQGTPMLLQSTTNTDLTGPLNYAWNLAGVALPGESVLHLFPGSGAFEVNHEVWTTIDGSAGCFGSISQMVTVAANPEVVFTNTPACAGSNFQLHDESLPDEGDEIIGWMWQSAGVLLGEENSISTQFEEPGSYPIFLSVTTSSGCQGQLNQIVEVSPAIPPEISLSDEIGPPPLAVDFTNPNEYGQTHWWEFGDGELSFEISPQHTYQDSGVYEVFLFVFDDVGCSGEAFATVYALEPYYDVAVKDVSYQLTDNQLQVSCVFANYNNHRLRSVELVMSLADGTRVSEVWEGSLNRNQLTSYTFQSKLNYNPQINEPVLCVEARKPNGVDADAVPENNKLCKSFGDEPFSLFKTYPNPATQWFVQPFNLEARSEIEWMLVQSDGKILLNRSETYPAGYHEWRVETGFLQSGTYIIQARWREKVFSRRVMINRIE